MHMQAPRILWTLEGHGKMQKQKKRGFVQQTRYIHAQYVVVCCGEHAARAAQLVERSQHAESKINAILASQKAQMVHIADLESHLV